jgi:putative spermidine/putrescine transport system ATP-binding protein
MARLALERLAKRYGGQAVVEDVSLEVGEGEFLSLLGPSGCGKTTILKMIAGLVEPSGGAIRIGETDVTRVPVHKRGLGLVFQSYALFPHLSVFENVAFGLRRQGARAVAVKGRVEEALAMVRMGHLAERLPKQLSGGQQQRIALARAIAPRPKLLLLDEPLSNLDAALRDDMQIEIKRLQRDLKITTVFVTHDQGEALTLSDRICIMSAGRVQQVASPEDIYGRPANAFVAGFLGKPNRLEGTVARRRGAGGAVQVAGGIELLADAVEGDPGETVAVFVRPEGVGLAPGGTGVPARLALRSFAGAHVQLVWRLADGTEIVAAAAAGAPLAAKGDGTTASLAVDPAAVFAFRLDGGGRA